MASWRPRRSVLFTPATRSDRWAKAVSQGHADVVVADLEDGVPLDHKKAARQALAADLERVEPSRSEVAVRVNRWPGAEAERDLESLDLGRVQLVVVPKAESAEALVSLSDRLDESGCDAKVMAILETARGVLEAPRLGDAGGRLAAVAFGAEDYGADVGARRRADNHDVLWARSRVVAAAAVLGVDAIDQVFVDFRDLDGLAQEARFAAELGYRGKMLVHPAQVGPVHRAMGPSGAEVRAARSLLRAVDEAGVGDGGVIDWDGRMVDRPLIEQARRVVAWSELGD